jgi:hypothetical protein
MRSISLGIAAAVCCLPAAAADRWSVEALAGNAISLGSKLDVRQDGGYSESFRGKYETRGFSSPLYYALRAARWEGDRAWEGSLVHHKIYLKNPPPGVANLSVSHGFNIVTLNRVQRSGDWISRFGLGPVITHAEATVNGVQYEGPYRLSGAAAIVSGARRYYVQPKLYFSLEGMVSIAYANPRLRGTPSAEIEVRNLALHGLLGLGYEF